MPLTDADVQKIVTQPFAPAAMLGTDKPISLTRAVDLLLRWSLEARDNAIVARQVAEAQALKGEALTPEEVDAIAAKVGERIAAGFDVVLEPKDTTP